MVHRVPPDQVAVLGRPDNWGYQDLQVIQAVQEILVLKDQWGLQGVQDLLEIEEPRVLLEILVHWGIRGFQDSLVHLEFRELQDHQELLVRSDLWDILDFKVQLEL